jgi:hypothetical protein
MKERKNHKKKFIFRFENSFGTLLDLVLDLKGNLNDTIQGIFIL